VSDAAPLISLGRLDLLPLLRALFTEVQVPEIVVDECLARPDNVDAQRIRKALASGLLLSCPAPPTPLAGLQPGESAAIARALEIGAALLVDERAARAHALSLGLAVTGTVGVLVRARRLALIGPLAPLLAALRASGQRLSDALVRQALSDVGETPD
jgi:predicted nucleic acid-binding protein